MARYTVSILTPLAPAEAFAYMADLKNFAIWDPGVKKATQVVGDGAGPDAAWDLVVKGFVGDMTMRYVTTEFEDPTRLVVVSESKNLKSVDVITVRAADEADSEASDDPSHDGGSVVTYDAELTMSGALALADPALELAFNKIGDAAAEGMVDALDGVKLDDQQMSAVSQIFDEALEIPIVTSFTRIGYQARRRLADWTDLNSYDLTGQVILITGGTSGLGRAAAEQVASMGATTIITGRSEERNHAAVSQLTEVTGNARISHVAADMAEPDQVAALAERLLADHDRLDALMHNAGVLANTRRVASTGIESTIASQVVGQFQLTSLLLDRLEASAPSRVITMSSGGMYTAPLTVTGLQMTEDDYSGAEQYARAKRAQVTLNEMWAERVVSRGIRFHALHPGWADTPGVAEALPVFGRIMGPLLRTPEEGADTMVWLAADDGALESNGGFWLDRKARSIHKLPTTRDSDTEERRTRLWNWVATAAGMNPAAIGPAPAP